MYNESIVATGTVRREFGVVPLTVKVVDRLTELAKFDAEQAYSPAWRAETPSMLRVLKCLLILVIVIPVSFDVSIGTPLNAHDISMGMSPFRIEQGTDTESPQLAISALKAMGRSCGPTKRVIKQSCFIHIAVSATSWNTCGNFSRHL
jgi:hypothetical protein